MYIQMLAQNQTAVIKISCLATLRNNKKCASFGITSFLGCEHGRASRRELQ